MEDKDTDLQMNDNSPKGKLDEKEASNLSDRGFRGMLIKILNNMKKTEKP